MARPRGTPITYASNHANITQPPAAVSIKSRSLKILPTKPIVIAAERPRIGVIKGAINIAAMITAMESRSIPTVAMTAEIAKNVLKRIQ
jgi:PBP1b-binding outer membrane lipoprotein LpoB